MSDEILKIGIVAVGGAGISMVSKLRADLPYLARFIAVDINKKALSRSNADIKILVGDGNHRPRQTDLARFLAQPIKSQILEAMAGLDVVFLVAGMGGVAGSALSLTVADLLRESPEILLSIGVPITPFAFEGPRRQKIAAIALKSLANRVDCLIPLRNEALAAPSSDGVLTQVLNQALVVLRDIYTGIAITSCENGFIGVDFDDIKTVFQGHRMTMGVATGYGADAVRDAVDGIQQLINAGEIPLSQALGGWIVVEGSIPSLQLSHVDEIMTRVENFILGEVPIGLSGFWHKESGGNCKIMVYAAVIDA